MSSRGSITYGVGKELAGTICPQVGQSQHHLKNTQHFIQKIQQVTLEPGEVIFSYDVKALFTSVPVDPAINIVKQRLTQDPSLSQRTQMSIPEIVTLLEFYLKNTYFLFRVSIMNRFMCSHWVQPWVPTSAPSQPTCSWKSLKPKHSNLLSTLSPMG